MSENKQDGWKSYWKPGEFTLSEQIEKLESENASLKARLKEREDELTAVRGLERYEAALREIAMNTKSVPTMTFQMEYVIETINRLCNALLGEPKTETPHE